MNTLANLDLETVDGVLMESFYSDLQPQPAFFRDSDPNCIEYEGNCNVTIIKDKGIIIALGSPQDGWIFRHRKEEILKVEMHLHGPYGSSITIYYKDPNEVQEHFYSRMFCQTAYDIRTLGKKIKDGLGLDVKELK